MYKFKSSKKFRLSEALPALILSAVLASALLLSSCAAGDDISPQRVENEQTEQAQQTEQTETTDSAGGEHIRESEETGADPEPYPYDAQYEIVLYSLPTILRLETGEYYSANADGSATYTMSSTGNLEDGISKITGGLELLGEVEYYEEYPFDRCPSDAIATNGGRLMIGSAVYYSPDDGSVTVVLPQGYENEDSLIIGYKLFRDDYYSTEEAQTEARSESVRNLRIATTVPQRESGGITTWTREPSGSLASRRGYSSLRMRPTDLAMLLAAAKSAASLGNAESILTSRPDFSM